MESSLAIVKFNCHFELLMPNLGQIVWAALKLIRVSKKRKQQNGHRSSSMENAIKH